MMEVPPSSTSSTPVPLVSAPPEWNSNPAWKLPGWAEPLIVVCVLFGACFYTRRRSISLSHKTTRYHSVLNSDVPADEDALLSNELGSSDSEHYESDFEVSTLKNPPKRRACCGITVLTPNTSRFAQNWHSRVLYKFPFLMEMFYWVITYIIYRLSHIFAQEYFSADIWDVAQENGLRVLAAEQFSPFRYFFPLMEISVQKWFMAGHETLLTVGNKIYALIHIPGTVYFIAWYYHAAPTHSIFAVVRRTMTLANLLAFSIFTLYPCMPPRLLPKEYGFVDTVRRDSAESVWMSGKFVNHLAAMPSMHFGYAFIIGCTCVYHAGGFRWLGCGYESRSGRLWKWALGCFGAFYPLSIMLIIVATANHYWLDVVAAIFVCAFALLCNRVFMVFMPLEDLLLWAIRLEKPKPNCGLARA